MPKPLKLKVPLFGSPIWIYVGEESVEQLDRDFKKHNGQSLTESGFDLESADGCCNGTFVWLRRLSLDTLTHELNHSVDSMLAHLNIEDPTGEVKSYILGWAVEKAWNRLNS